MPTLYLNTLTCKVAEDWNLGLKQDEPRIKVNGEPVADLNVEEGLTYSVDKSVHFTGEARITLVERDTPDGEDFLGEHVVKQGSDTLKFTKDDAYYLLSYEVTE
jgi:hypothetical protein